LLQLALVFFIGRLIWSFWQRRNAPAFAGANPGANPAAGTPGNNHASSLLGGLFGGGSGGGAQPQPEGPPVELKAEDFDAFERLLREVLVAYGAEDMNALRSRVTPEM